MSARPLLPDVVPVSDRLGVQVADAATVQRPRPSAPFVKDVLPQPPSRIPQGDP